MSSRLLALFVLFSLLPFLTGATIVIRGPRVPAAGGGSPAEIASGSTGGTINGVTSASYDTTGANLIILSVAWAPSGGADVTTAELTDSKSNTWTQLNLAGTIGVSGTANRLFYCYGGTVGTGHTFTVTETGSYPTISVLALSNMASSPLDQQSQNNPSGFGTTGQPGSITASQANTVLVSGLAFDAAGTISIDLSFGTPVTVARSAGNHVGGSISWRIDTSASATNPTWTNSGGNSFMTSSIASFKY
jgi:hypothetical protein